MARSHTSYNLIWYPAPDSYSATNAATASAFVLSESYLYTTNAVVGSLQHLAPDGIFVAQFGEIDYKTSPYRTTRFVATARQALADMGISDPQGSHPGGELAGPLLRVLHLVDDPRQAAPPSRAPRSTASSSSLSAVPGTTLQYAPGPRRRAEPRRHGGLEHSRAAALVLLLVSLQRGAHHGQRSLLLALRPLRHASCATTSTPSPAPTASTRWASASSCSCSRWRS